MMVIVARVVIIDGIPIFTDRAPLHHPKKNPTNKAIKDAKPQCMKYCKPIVMEPHSANMEPTDMSNPAPMIIKVVPTAIIPMTEPWRKILKIFSTVIKLGVKKDNPAQNKNKTMHRR
tara:strand:- start:583 stop:933 length:351 start_codon:yes stop_codon:yes gene_type:complete